MGGRLTADQFFQGLFAALRVRGWPDTMSVRGDRLDQALGEVFRHLMVIAQARDLDVRFRVRPHPLHGDSPTVRNMIASAADGGIISLDNPEYQDVRLALSVDEANLFLARLPGGSELFAGLADEFEKSYEQVVT